MSTEPSTEIATFAPDNLPALFQSPDQVDSLIAKITEVVESFVPDVTTAKGRKDIAALAYKVARTKTALDDAGKGLNETKRKEIDAVDEQRRSLRAKLDALRDRARKPLDEWEAAEAKREEAVKGILARIDNMMTTAAQADATAEGLNNCIIFLEALEFDADVFQSWLEIAIKRKTDALDTLRGYHARAVKAEADAAELAELRRKEAERVEREAAEQAKAKRIADEKAEAERIEREAKAEKERADHEALEREERQKREIAEAEKRASEKAAADAQAEAQRLIDAANAEAERLRKAEETRLAEVAAAEAEQRARDQDRAHRGKVMATAKEALMTHSGISEEQAKKIVLAIKAGEIPNVTLVF